MKTEHQEQVDFFFRARGHFRSTDRRWMRSLLFAIPNGGLRNKRIAGALKLEGVVKGIPDIFFAYPMHGSHGLFIEMKTEKGRVSPDQKEVIGNLKSQGYTVEVATGADHAMSILLHYMHEVII